MKTQIENILFLFNEASDKSYIYIQYSMRNNISTPKVNYEYTIECVF